MERGGCASGDKARRAGGLREGQINTMDSFIEIYTKFPTPHYGESNIFSPDKDLRNRVREFNIQVYGIAVADPKDDPSAGRGRWVFEDITRQTGTRTFLSDADAGFGRAVLDEMARASGGTAYFPRTVEGERELAGICTQIALELRRQYTLAFRHAGAPAEAAWHELEVRVAPPAGTGRLRLSYRKGYRSFKK